MSPLRIPSPLSSHEEDVVRSVLDSAVRVHRELGPGLLEHFYRRAMCLELKGREVSFNVEHPVPIHSRDRLLGVQRLDLVVEGRVVVELKAVQRLDTVHLAQILSYLRASRLRVGLLLNFNAARLFIRRVVL